MTDEWPEYLPRNLDRPMVVTWEEPALFDMPPVEPEPVEQLSADRRRTIRRQNLLDSGRHPTTFRPLLNQEWGFTCGDCDHRLVHRTDKTFHKCERAAGGLTCGPGSDVRVSWPACELFRTSKDTE